MKLDEKDKKLLFLLQHDAKKTTKQLAAELSLSVTAVFERIKKLERNQVIRKYIALLDKEKINRNFIAVCHVKLDQHRKDHITRFEAEIIKFPEVLDCYHVSGDYDYILKIHVADIQEYREFMVAKLTTLEHIASTKTSFSIRVVKSSTVFDL